MHKGQKEVIHILLLLRGHCRGSGSHFHFEDLEHGISKDSHIMIDQSGMLIHRVWANESDQRQITTLRPAHIS